MISLTPQEKKAVEEFRERVKRVFGPQVKEMRLFGSRARGEGDESSDVDVLILLDVADAKDRGQIFEIAADILLEYEIDISPLVMSEAHFSDMRRRERLLPLEIEREGVVL